MHTQFLHFNFKYTCNSKFLIWTPYLLCTITLYNDYLTHSFRGKGWISWFNYLSLIISLE